MRSEKSLFIGMVILLVGNLAGLGLPLLKLIGFIFTGEWLGPDLLDENGGPNNAYWRMLAVYGLSWLVGPGFLIDSYDQKSKGN